MTTLFSSSVPPAVHLLKPHPPPLPPRQPPLHHGCLFEASLSTSKHQPPLHHGCQLEAPLSTSSIWTKHQPGSLCNSLQSPYKDKFDLPP